MAKEPQSNLKEVVIPGVSNDELKKLLEENLLLTQEIHEMTHKIKRYVTFQKLMSFVYLVLIVGPIVLSFFFLQDFFKGSIGQYKSIMEQYNQLLNPANSGAILNSVQTINQGK